MSIGSMPIPPESSLRQSGPRTRYVFGAVRQMCDKTGDTGAPTRRTRPAGRPFRRVAAGDGWPPAAKAFLGLNCPACSKALEICTCTNPIWEKDDQGKLKNIARNLCGELSRKGKHASATIDGLTVGMALRHELRAVTGDVTGAEWSELGLIIPNDFAKAVGKPR